MDGGSEVFAERSNWRKMRTSSRASSHDMALTKIDVQSWSADKGE